MNLSQLTQVVKKANWLREFVSQTHFPLNESFKEDFSLKAYKDSIHNISAPSNSKNILVDHMTEREERRTLELNLSKLSRSIKSQSRELAESLNRDANADLHQDGISLQNMDTATAYFNTPSLKASDLRAHTGQKVLGAFFRALDEIVRVTNDQNSFVGNTDLAVSGILDYLDTLQVHFSNVIVSILDKVKPQTLSRIEQEIKNNSERFYTDLQYLFENVKQNQWRRSKSKVA